MDGSSIFLLSTIDAARKSGSGSSKTLTDFRFKAQPGIPLAAAFSDRQRDLQGKEARGFLVQENPTVALEDR